MANDAPAEFPVPKVERYFSLLMLFINGQKMVSNDANLWKTDFLPPNHCPIIFHAMSPLFSQMSPHFQVSWDIVPSYGISRQNTAKLTNAIDIAGFQYEQNPMYRQPKHLNTKL